MPIAALGAAGLLAVTGAGSSRRPRESVPHRHVVEIRGMAFHPAVLDVERGDTVVWVNRDIVPHTATATWEAGWNTGPLLQGKSGRYVASRRGEHSYACELHPTMLGRVVVR